MALACGLRWSSPTARTAPGGPIMKLGLKWIGLAALGLGGCATTGGRSTGWTSDFAAAEGSPLRVVATRAVDSRVHPMVPVHMAADGAAVAVTFGERGRQQVVERLDPASLNLLSSEAAGRSEAPGAPSTGSARVQLEGGRFVELWTQDNADGGRQAMAQLWSATGSRL